MDPAGLLARCGPDLARRGPKAQRAVAYRYHRRGHATPLELAQQRLPALGALPVAVLDREQLLLAVGPRPDHDQRTEPVLFEPDVEVHSIDPHVNVLAAREVAPAKGRVFFLPAGGKPCDVGRRQTARVLTQQAFERGAEIPGGEPAQIENRQYLGDFGRTPHVGRQNAAGETLPLALFITPAVVDPPRPQLHPPRAQGKLAPLRAAVVHYQRPSLIVALVTMTLDVVVGFRLQRRHQHPPRSHPCDLVQLKKLPFSFPSSPIFYYLQHRWRLLPPGSHRGSRCLRGR